MNEDNQIYDLEFYKSAYEQEKARSASLAGRLADAKNEADNLQFQLDRIKNNPVWKWSIRLEGIKYIRERPYLRIF